MVFQVGDGPSPLYYDAEKQAAAYLCVSLVDMCSKRFSVKSVVNVSTSSAKAMDGPISSVKGVTFTADGVSDHLFSPFCDSRLLIAPHP